MWSNQTLRAFFAITIHYTTGDGDQKLELRSRLGAFRHVLTRHTGLGLAQQFVCVLEELGILHRVGTISKSVPGFCVV